jgi:hypothetical protein
MNNHELRINREETPFKKGNSVESTFLKKLAVLTSSIAMAAVAVVVIPVTSASAASRQNANFGFYISSMSNTTNSTGIFDIPQASPSTELEIGISYSGVVSTGSVVAGDIITVSTSLVNADTNAAISANVWTGDPNNQDFLGQRNTQEVYYSWNFPKKTELVRTHTVSSTDISQGWFAGGTFRSNGNVTSGGVTIFNDYGSTNYSIVRTADLKKVKLNVVWKKNGTVISSTNTFSMTPRFPWATDVDEQQIDSETATAFFDQTQGSYLNAGGCVDTTGLAVGDVLAVDFSFTVDGKRPEFAYSSLNKDLYWYTESNSGQPPSPGNSGWVSIPDSYAVNSYQFTSSTTAEINISEKNFNKVGGKVTFRGTTLATVFPASSYTISATQGNHTIIIAGTGWTAGSQTWVGGNNYIDPVFDSEADTYELTMTQGMIDGYVNGGIKTNMLGLSTSRNGVLVKPGLYKFAATAHKKGETANRVISCAADDVVNLTATKNTDGDTVITFQEQSGSKYSAANRHFCQLKTTAGGTVGAGIWIGGVMATEVTPSTTPRTFKCVVGDLEDGASYQLVLRNMIGSGWSNKLQTTWVNFKNAPDVSTDATLISAGIGTATAETTFAPATLTYSVTSKDITTPYPNVVTSNSKSTYVVKLGGIVVTKGAPLNLKTGANVVTIEVTSPSGAKKTYTFNVNKVDVAADATLSGLAFGSETLTPAFSSSTTTYSASVSSTTTEYPFPTATATQDGTTVVVKNAGIAVTGPGALSLVDGLNVITVEVTAPNGTTKKTYTMNINKAPAAKDATLSALPSVSGVTSSPSFDADVTSYTGNVSESTTAANLTGATTNVNGATVIYKLNGVVVTPPATLNLRPGDNKLETIVASSDGTVKKTYTQTITRAVLAAGSSTDANDARLAVNPVPGASYVAKDGTTVEGFDSELSYEPNVYIKNAPANQTSVRIDAGGAANSAATIVNEYSTDGGVTWTTVTAPGTAPLTNGKTTKIRTTVTQGASTKVYVTDVIRPAIDPNADVAPAEGDGDIPAKGIAGTGKFIASNDPTFKLAWTKGTGKLISQATGVYIGYIEAKVTFTKAGTTYTCTTVFGTTTALPAKTAAQKAAAMKSKTFTGKQFCIDKIKLNPATTAPVGGLTKVNFPKIKTMNKTTTELNREKAALAALKGFTGEVKIQVTRYRAWPSTMLNLGNWDSKGGKISVQVRNTKVALN